MFSYWRGRDKDRYLNRIISRGIIALIICLLICTLHIIDVKRNFEKETKQNVESYLTLSAENISDFMSRSMGMLEQAASAMVREGQRPDKDGICLVLSEYQGLNDFSTVTFIDNQGDTYHANGNIVLSDEVPIEIADVEENEILFFKEYALEDSRGAAIYVVPVVLDGRRLGELVGVQSVSNMLEGYGLDYLNEIGDTFLINLDGEILISQTKKFAEKLEEQTNIFELFQSIGEENEQNAAEIAELRKNLNNYTFNEATLSTKEGKFFVAYREIDSVGHFSLIHAYGEEVFNQILQPMLYRSVAAVAIIVITMLSMLIYVWICLRKNIKIIEQLAYQDPITKGKNLNYFKEKATRIINEQKRTSFAVARFDILNFRYINEAYGHLKADDLLTIVDMEGNNSFKDKELCVRMNADQFVVLLKNNGNYKTKIQEFTDSINIRAIEIGIIYPIKLKCGIYQIRNDDRDIELIIDRANAARKSLTGNEKDFFVSYSDRIINDLRKTDKIESDMEKALVNGEFKLYLQPKWNIEKDELYGAEALVRWVKPDGTIISPSQFIPIFERNGFIEKLDFYMLTNVCRMIHNLEKNGMPLFPISVNQSRRLWDSPDYVEHVDSILKSFQIPSHMVELEVTETVFFGEQDKMLSIIHELKKKEVLLSMDDFGSGYSSLNLLKQVPFDVLKIDREFFSESVTSKSSTWILQKIIEMVEGLNIRVLCEGVETKAQVEMLRKLGCKYVQGYYYSRPLTVGAFLEKYFGDHIELSDDDGKDTKTE